MIGIPQEPERDRITHFLAVFKMEVPRVQRTAPLLPESAEQLVRARQPILGPVPKGENRADCKASQID